MIPHNHDLEQRVAWTVQEDVEIAPYDPRWPAMFEEEKEWLRAWLPSELIGRIEHFGSTAVPGLAAKPIVDMLVEVTSLEEVNQRVVPILESKGYDYFWRPTWGDDVPPWYAWFIRRNAEGVRTHHIHMVESYFEHGTGSCFEISSSRILRRRGNIKHSKCVWRRPIRMIVRHTHSARRSSSREP